MLPSSSFLPPPPPSLAFLFPPNKGPNSTDALEALSKGLHAAFNHTALDIISNLNFFHFLSVLHVCNINALFSPDSSGADKIKIIKKQVVENIMIYNSKISIIRNYNGMSGMGNNQN